MAYVDMVGDFQCSILRDSYSYFTSAYLGTELSFYTQDIITPNGKIQIIKNNDYQYYINLVDGNDSIVSTVTYNTDANTVNKMYICLQYNNGSGRILVFSKRTNSTYPTCATSSYSSGTYNWIMDNKNNSEKNFRSVNEVAGIYGIMYDPEYLNSSDNILECLWNNGIYQANTSAEDEYEDYYETCYDVNTNINWENKVHFLKSGSIIKTKTNDGLRIEIADSEDEIIGEINFVLPPEYTNDTWDYDERKRIYYKEEYYSGIFSMGFGIDDDHEDGFIFIRMGYISKLYKRYNTSDPYVYCYDRYPSIYDKRSVRNTAIYNWIKANEINSSGWKYVSAINDSKGNAVQLSKVQNKYANGGRRMQEWRKYYQSGTTQTRIIVEPTSELHYNIDKYMNPQ